MALLNFFRRTKSASNNLVSIGGQQVESKVKQVDKALFVDDQEPVNDSQLKKAVNHIEDFLNQKFEWMGYNEGYSYPEMEYLETKLKVIRSEFRLAVDKAMDVKRSELGELKLHLIKTSGISTRLESQLLERIKQLEVQIHELDTQKILSVETEGIVSIAAHNYRLGFVKGVEKYQQEKLFAVSTGLFHQ